MDAIKLVINSKNIRETSKKTHLQRLSFLYVNLQDNIYKPAIVKKFINERYDNANSKRNYYDSLYNLTNNQFYKTIMDKLIQEVNKTRMDNTIDSNNFLTIDELKAIPANLEQKIKADYKINQSSILFLNESLFYSLNKRLQQKYIRDVLDYIILILHIYHPLRLDYYNMKIIFRKKDLTKDQNYFLIKGKQASIHMNVYKNSNSYDTTNIQQVDSFVTNIILNWIKIYKIIFQANPEYLLYTLKTNLNLVNYANRASLGSYLTQIIKKYSGDMHHITINDIRKIYESNFIQSEEYNKLTNKEKSYIHSKLLHTISSANLDYNKIKK